jgi:trehalose synthase
VPFREIDIRPLDPVRLAPVIGAERMREVAEAASETARILVARTLVNVNSTAVGGGVAELLQALLGYARGGGVATRWFVVEGDTPFFGITKRIHNGLYGSAGDGGPLGAAERAAYERTLHRNAREIDGRVRPGDVVLLHDPQTAGLAPAFRRLGASVVWRCHVGSDRMNDWTERSWQFLRPYLEDVEAYVFSSRRFAPAWVDPERVRIISPSIDPLSLKNTHLSRAEARALLVAAGLVAGDPRAPRPRFRRPNGRVGVVKHRALVVQEAGPPPAHAPLVVQISRWDRTKDMAGVMAGFAERFDIGLGAHLMLAGPQVDGVADDPEAAGVFADCCSQWEALPAVIRRHVHLACLSTADHAENSVVTNALQHHAAVVCQKSLAEGFGLTVAEAMWKARPVVASAVGGIVDQIRGPDCGVLLEDPTDLPGFGAAVDGILRAPSEARRLGANARRFARQYLLVDLHLKRYAELIKAFESTAV